MVNYGIELLSPVLVEELGPGTQSGVWGQGVRLGDKLLINARVSEERPGEYALATYDPVTKSVNLLSDVQVDAYWSNPKLRSTNGQTLFFIGKDAAHGNELWKTDGTPEGTTLVSDIHVGPRDTYFDWMTLIGDTLFLSFQGYRQYGGIEGTQFGKELWVSDGTSDGTQILKDLYYGSSSPYGAAILNNQLMFAAEGYAFGKPYQEYVGRELYISDGSKEGTVLVKDINPGSGNSVTGVTTEGQSDFAVAGSYYYFIANDGTHGSELWKSDGTELGTSLVKDITDGSASSSLTSFTPAGDKLYFINKTSSNDNVLWVSDGTEVGTKMLEINASENDWSSILSYNNGILYFRGDGDVDGLNETELWRTDGTDLGTFQLIDAWQGPAGSSPLYVATVGEYMFFKAYGGTGADYMTWQTYGTELYISDGTVEGTARLWDFVPGYQGSYPGLVGVVGNDMILTFNTEAQGVEPWLVDVSALEPTYELDITEPTIINISLNTDGRLLSVNFSEPISTPPADWAGGFELSVDGQYVALSPYASGIAKLILSTEDTIRPGQQIILQYDPSLIDAERRIGDISHNKLAGIEGILVQNESEVPGSMVVDLDPARQSRPHGFEMNGTLFSFLTEGSYDTQYQLTPKDLWISNGTQNGTIKLTSVSSFLGTLDDGSMLYSDLSRGALWKFSDEPELVSELSPYVDYIQGSGVQLDGKFFFRSYNSGLGRDEIWVTDGTSEGTSFIFENGYILESDDHEPFYGGKLLLKVYADDANELWITDGTTGGTSKIPTGNIILDDYASSGDNLFVTGSLQHDDTYGSALWILDETMASPRFLLDPAPGLDEDGQPIYSSFRGFYSLNNSLVFLAEDEHSNTYAWRSDGTVNGTYKLSESVLADYGQLAIKSDNYLYFVGLNQESDSHSLWVTDGTSLGTKILRDFYDPLVQESSYPTYQPYLTPRGSFGNHAFFNLNHWDHDIGAYRTDVWVSNGTLDGTKLFESDVAFPSDYYRGAESIVYQGHYYSSAWTRSGAADGELFAFDISELQAYEVLHPFVPPLMPGHLVSLNGLTYDPMLLQNYSAPIEFDGYVSAGPLGSTTLVNDAVFTDTGSVVLVGETWAAFPDWSSPLGGQTDAYVLELGLDGSIRRSLQLDTPSYDEARSVAVAPDGSIYVVGEASLTGDILTGGTLAKSGDKGFIVKYSPDLSQQWIRQQTIEGDYGLDGVTYSAVAVDSADGSIVVGGQVWGSLQGLPYYASGDASLQKYDQLGNLVWSASLGSPKIGYSGGIESFVQVAVGPESKIYAAGTTDAALSGQISAGNYDIVLAQYDSSGALQWTKQFGTNKSDHVKDLVVDSSGSAYILANLSSGWTTSTLLNVGSSVASLGAQAALVKFDSTGYLQWYDLISTGTTSGVYGDRILLNDDGSIYVSGTSYAGFDSFYGGSGDQFLAKYLPDGSQVELLSYGDSGSQSVYAMQLQASSLLLAGSATSLDGIDLDQTATSAKPYLASYSFPLATSEHNTAVALRYAMTATDGDPLALSSLAVLGDSVEDSSRYNIVITAESLRDGWTLEAVDFTFGFDTRLFGAINASDIRIASSMPLANAVAVDNEAGIIRIAAGSIAGLGSGTGIAAEAVLATITVDFEEAFLELQKQNPDGSLIGNPLFFSLQVNPDEVVLSRSFTDEEGLLNHEIASLSDLGSAASTAGIPVTLYDARINLEQQGEGMVLGTQRVIGADAGFTNLVRTNDVLSVTSEWLNVGNITANNVRVSSMVNTNASMIDAQVANSVLKSGGFVNGVFVEEGRESTTITAQVRIHGSAGSVVNLADNLFFVEADGSGTFSNAGKGTKNLITYQGDLNYDGRVSMKDLAYLNAGAARQVLDGTGVNARATAESYARDVDADFNGKIDLADLAVLDTDWGKSLHIADEEFVGSSSLDWAEIDTQGAVSWDNDSFKGQNAIEASADYIGSLETPGVVGVIGADGDIDPVDSDITGTFFQQPVMA